MAIENTAVERIQELVEKQRAFYATGTTRDVQWRKQQLKAFKAGLQKWAANDRRKNSASQPERDYSYNGEDSL